MKDLSKHKIAQRLKELRAAKGITQKELGQQTGLSCGTIVGYENSMREPNSRSMAKLENYFNVSGAYLRGETDEREATYLWQDDEISNAVKDGFSTLFGNLLIATRQCKGNDQKMVFDIMVELRHILLSPSMSEKQVTASLMLLQSMFSLSTQFVDVCARSDKPTGEEDTRISKMKQSCVGQYADALSVVEKAIL